MFRSEKSYKDFLLGILLGGSISATSAFLLKTKQGKKIQKEIINKYHEMAHAAEHYLKSKGVKTAKSKATVQTRKKKKKSQR